MIGGSVKSVSLGGFTFAVPADTVITIDLGGSSNEVLSNGDGSSRLIKTAKSWMVEGLNVAVDLALGQLEDLNSLLAQNDFFECQFELQDATYSGAGQISGEIKWSSDSTAATCDIAGSGKLTRQ